MAFRFMKKRRERTLSSLVTDLCQSNQQRTLRMFKRQLKDGADPKAQDKGGHTPLHKVVEFHACNQVLLPETTLEMATLLLEYGADPDEKDPWGRTPLHTLATWPTAQEEDTTLRMVRLLLDHGADPNAKEMGGYTPLHRLACQLTRDNAAATLKMVRLLLEHQANPNLQDTMDGHTPLHQMIFPFRKDNQESTLAIIRLHLQYGADLGAQNKYGLTPLHCLTCQELTQDNQAGTVEMIRLLLNHGADPNIQDMYGYTPLHRLFYQFERNDPETMLAVTSTLLEGKVNLGVQDRNGGTVIHLLVGGVNKIIRNPKATLPLLTKLLLEETVLDLNNIQDKSGRTVLHCIVKKITVASTTVHKAYVWRELHTLLEHGADPTIKDKFGNLPWDYFHTRDGFDSTDAFLFIQGIIAAGVSAVRIDTPIVLPSPHNPSLYSRLFCNKKNDHGCWDNDLNAVIALAALIAVAEMLFYLYHSLSERFSIHA